MPLPGVSFLPCPAFHPSCISSPTQHPRLVSPSFPSPSNVPRSSHRPEPQVRGHFLVCGGGPRDEVTGRRRLLWGFGEEVSPQRCDKASASCLDAWPLSRPLTKRDFHRSQTSHRRPRQEADCTPWQPGTLGSEQESSLAGWPSFSSNPAAGACPCSPFL